MFYCGFRHKEINGTNTKYVQIQDGVQLNGFKARNGGFRIKPNVESQSFNNKV